ncbi:cytochrome c [Thalassotalea profundi]|uniref:Cytochrome c n=2 Tax=Thalassotalea profundi TaxID=2036687 RepID=A0ABQ3J144_9GAMM|nr:cytochrome c [Thalassotalea profundi]
MPESYRQCIACHGEQGEGNTQLKSPALAGQSANYLNRQLLNFTNGLRGRHEKDVLGMQMVAISKQLDLNTEVPQITTFLAALPSPTIEHQVTGDLKNGDRYYQARCGACHGGQAQGNPSMNSPKLSGQSIDYLRRQMINFSTGIRGTHSDDKLGRQMAMMSKTSSGKELEDIFYYISTQK